MPNISADGCSNPTADGTGRRITVALRVDPFPAVQTREEFLREILIGVDAIVQEEPNAFPVDLPMVKMHHVSCSMATSGSRMLRLTVRFCFAPTSSSPSRTKTAFGVGAAFTLHGREERRDGPGDRQV